MGRRTRPGGTTGDGTADPLPPPITARVVGAALVRSPALVVVSTWYALLTLGLGAGFGHAYATDQSSAQMDLVWWLVLPVYALVCLAAYRALGSLWRVSLRHAVHESYM